jgi:hypothetical protein
MQWYDIRYSCRRYDRLYERPNLPTVKTGKQKIYWQFLTHGLDCCRTMISQLQTVVNLQLLDHVMLVSRQSLA